jgi:hypothetical protein
MLTSYQAMPEADFLGSVVSRGGLSLSAAHPGLKARTDETLDERGRENVQGGKVLQALQMMRSF